MVSSVFTMTGVVLLLLGVALGLAAGYFAFPAIRQAKLLRVQLDQLLQEHQDYKASVDTHFRKTAELVGDMTRSYAAVYDHLAGGARSFCDDAGAQAKIPFGPLPGALASPVIETSATGPIPAATDPEPAVDDGAPTADNAAARETTAEASPDTTVPTEGAEFPEPSPRSLPS